MSIAALLGVIWHFSKEKILPYLKEKAVPFLKEHWKQITAFILLCWVVMCLLTHCSGVIDPWGHHSTNDTIRTVDTAWVYPDTNAIFALKWKNLKPVHEKHIADSLRRKWKGSKYPRVEVSNTPVVSDSALRHAYEMLSLSMEECDDAYHDAITIRTYRDTLRNDSIELRIALSTEGRLYEEPSVQYRYLKPYPVITVKETVTEVLPPKRKIYVELGGGPDMNLDHSFNSLRMSFGVGYMDRKDWGYGIRGSFSGNVYGIEGTVRRSIPIGK